MSRRATSRKRLDARRRGIQALVVELDRLAVVAGAEVGDQRRRGRRRRAPRAAGSVLPTDFDIFSWASRTMPLWTHSRASGSPWAAQRLGRLVLMVREGQVRAAAVDLEVQAEQLLGHRRALDVPAGTAATPGRIPGGVLAGLLRLPQREVERIALAVGALLALALIEVLELAGATARRSARSCARRSTRRRRPRRRDHARSAAGSAR